MSVETDLLSKDLTESAAEHFGGSRVSVDRIEVIEDEDADGDRILRIRVLLRGGTGTIPAKDFIAFTTKVRGKLDVMKDDRFPVLSFIAAEELDHRARS